MSDLSEWLSREALEDYAGSVIYQRGEAYFRQGAVSRLRDAGGKVTARVNGTEAYQVELWTTGEEFEYDCTCPHAAEGNFCKHCVAVGLAFLDGRARGFEPGTSGDEAWDAVRRYLELQPPETLIDWLLDAAQQDDGLYRKLLLKAQRAGGTVDVVKTFRREIDNATRTHGYLDYDEAAEFAEDLDQLVDSLEELQTPESAALLVELAEYAIDKIAKSMDSIEDSEGEVYQVLERLQELHRDVCGMAQPDPVLLAERLFRYEIVEGVDVFYGSLSAYQDVLGPSGLQRFRELVEAAWRDVPPLSDHGNRGADFSGQRWHLSRIMEHFAQSSGDIEALVAIKSRDLSSADRYLEIAKIYQDAGRPDKALDWAERGLREFQNRPSNPLRDFLAAAYLERGRKEEALQLVWVQFAEQPRLEHYQKLRQLAETLGVWPEQRERALAELEAATLRALNARKSYMLLPAMPDHSERVRIALWEGDLESAWEAVQNGVCELNLRLSLAGRLEASRPGDALSLYLSAIESWIEKTNNHAYEEAIRLLRKAKGLMSAEEFAGYRAELRTKYKPKRNFIALLEKLRA